MTQVASLVGHAPDAGGLRAGSRLAMGIAAVVLIVVGVFLVSVGARAETFRCESAGQVSYGDRACADGQPSRVLANAPSPSSADQAVARDRLRRDQRTLATLEQQRTEQRRGDRDDARRAQKDAAQRDRQVRACTKLASRARRAHEDLDSAAPRERTRRQAAAQRGDDDYAALCRGRAG